MVVRVMPSSVVGGPEGAAVRNQTSHTTEPFAATIFTPSLLQGGADGRGQFRGRGAGRVQLILAE